MERNDVMAWVAEYVRSWREGDVTGVERLFTEQAHYRPSPYEESEVGHDAIKAFWLDDAGETFTADAELIAVEGRRAVVRVEVRYGEPVNASDHRLIPSMSDTTLHPRSVRSYSTRGGIVGYWSVPQRIDEQAGLLVGDRRKHGS